jgi:hypothetical protein
LIGGGGADLLAGGGAADRLTGNGGADTFRYQATSDSVVGASDQITDFTPGEDKIDVSRIDANIVAAGDQQFTFIDDDAFAGSGAASAGQLRAFQLHQNGPIWRVEGDTDGNGTADLVIEVVVTGSAPLTGSDFSFSPQADAPAAKPDRVSTLQNVIGTGRSSVAPTATTPTASSTTLATAQINGTAQADFFRLEQGATTRSTALLPTTSSTSVARSRRPTRSMAAMVTTRWCCRAIIRAG